MQESIITFLLGWAIQGNIQFSGYVLSLPAVAPSHAIICHRTNSRQKNPLSSQLRHLSGQNEQ